MTIEVESPIKSNEEVSNVIKICSFLGHEKQYDKNLNIDLTLAIYEIINKNNAIEFIFHQYNDFYKSCYNIVLKAKKLNSDKQITLAIISESSLKKTYWSYYIGGANDVFDKYIYQTMSTINQEYYRSFNNSDFIICYVYEILEKQLIKDKKIANKTNAQIISITSEATQKLIKEQMQELKPRQKDILAKRIEGKTLKQIGISQNVSGSAIRRVEAEALRELRKIVFDSIKEN